MTNPCYEYIYIYYAHIMCVCANSDVAQTYNASISAVKLAKHAQYAVHPNTLNGLKFTSESIKSLL